jgi:hypothetical protein
MTKLLQTAKCFQRQAFTGVIERLLGLGSGY